MLLFLWKVQMFVSVLAMVAITLAAIVHDRKQMEGELNQMNYTLESQVIVIVCIHSVYRNLQMKMPCFKLWMIWLGVA